MDRRRQRSPRCGPHARAAAHRVVPVLATFAEAAGEVDDEHLWSLGSTTITVQPPTAASRPNRCRRPGTGADHAVAEGESVAGGDGIGAQRAAGRVEGAVEEHRLDADVVVEPLQVPQVGYGGCGVDVQVRGAVRRRSAGGGRRRRRRPGATR